jgi:hypothetical protein
MDQAAEPESVSPHAHAAALRALIVAAVVDAITGTVARYTERYPTQPWQLDCRPGAARLEAELDLALDDVLEVALGRPLDGRMLSFPSRCGLA